MEKEVIVLGRGRAGTSLVAGLLDKLGVDMGKSRPSSPNNPKGYFEDKEIMDILDRYIQPIEEDFVTDCPEFEKEFKEYAEKKSGIWGWKQPNTLYVLSLIVKHLKNPHFIICHRNWDKQAESIKWAFHGGLKSFEECKKTIVDYYIKLDEFFKDKKYHRLDIKFENFFNYTNKEISKLCDFLGLPFDEKFKEFIDPNQPKFYENRNDS